MGGRERGGVTRRGDVGDAVIVHLYQVGNSGWQILRARCGEEDRDPFGGKGIQGAEQIRAMPVVEARERFVQAQETGIEHQGPGEQESV